MAVWFSPDAYRCITRIRFTGGILFRVFFAGLGWMAAWAGAAGLVNFSVRTEWLALLTCGADAAGYASGEFALIKCLTISLLDASGVLSVGAECFERSI